MASGVSWLHTRPPLLGCWYLSHHWDHDAQQRTYVGSLVNRAKTYDGQPGSPGEANRLASLMAESAVIVMDKRPFPLRRVQLVVPIPSYPPKEPHNLPDILAEHLSRAIGAEYDDRLLSKSAETPPAKSHTPDEIRRFIPRSYRVSRRLHNERILLVDDIVRSAETLRSIAGLIVQAGAGKVGAFVATKADRGLHAEPPLLGAPF
jgi:hypothetical protein